jgi:hypothetical protein
MTKAERITAMAHGKTWEYALPVDLHHTSPQQDTNREEVPFSSSVDM